MTTYAFPFSLGDEVWTLDMQASETGCTWRLLRGTVRALKIDADGGYVFAVGADGKTEMVSFAEAFQDEEAARAFSNALGALSYHDGKALLQERSRLLKEALCC